MAHDTCGLGLGGIEAAVREVSGAEVTRNLVLDRIE
jgi:hypothetical protein